MPVKEDATPKHQFASLRTRQAVSCVFAVVGDNSARCDPVRTLLEASEEVFRSFPEPFSLVWDVGLPLSMAHISMRQFENSPEADPILEFLALRLSGRRAFVNKYVLLQRGSSFVAFQGFVLTDKLCVFVL